MRDDDLYDDDHKRAWREEEESLCVNGCLRGEGHEEACLTDEDVAEERLKARDYDAWANL